MRVVAVMVAKDEEDVIGRTLLDATRWASHVLVLDNGSSDGTVAAVQELEASHPAITFVGIDRRPFTDGLRGTAAVAGAGLIRPGDWWCRLDADETVIGDPRDVLARVRPPYDAVEGSMFKYYLTTEDVAAHDEDPEAWCRTSLEDRLRWYRNDWAELRFLRHRRGLRWDGAPWPLGRPRVFPERVPFRHYQYRSPQQVTRRLEVRADVADFSQERDFATRWSTSLYEPAQAGLETWRTRLAKRGSLDLDDGGPLRERPDLLPPLPELPGPAVRLADRMLSGTATGRAARRRLRALRGPAKDMPDHA